VCHKHELSTSQFHRPKQGKKCLFTETESLRFLSYLVEIILASLLKILFVDRIMSCEVFGFVALTLHAVSFCDAFRRSKGEKWFLKKTIVSNVRKHKISYEYVFVMMKYWS